MKLVHHSPHKIVSLYDRTQTSKYDKPAGLWVSDEDDYSWAEWCTNNSPSFLQEYKYDITLADDANIIYLNNPEKIDLFAEKYKSDDLGLVSSLTEFSFIRGIDWPAIAGEYDGIIITPYQWSRRLSGSRWYYCWDCASGCIWAKKAIKSFTLVV